MGPKRSPAFYLGILCISAASLVFQVSLSRILSVTQGYHFAFLVVSTALLGIGSAGTYLGLPLRFLSLEPERLVVLGPFLFGITAGGAYLGLNQIPFDVVRLAWEARQLGYLLLAYLMLGIPFFFSGLTIASAFLIKNRPVGRIYFSDLVGAACGAFLPLVILPAVGGAGAVAVAVVLGILAGLLLWADTGDMRLWRAVLLLCILESVFLSGSFLFPGLYALQISPYRGLMMALRYPAAELLETRWNAISRVDVVQSPAARFAPGLSLTYTASLPPQLGITVDADPLHTVTAYEGAKAGLEFLEYLPASAAYQVARPEKVFIANPGGGLDVLMALYFDVALVEVSERNPLIPEMIKNTEWGLRSVIYQDPRIHLSIGHERSFLRSMEESYDLMAVSQISTLGVAAGLTGIAEDYSLTLEAFKDYFGHLSKNGWLLMTRYLEPQPVYAVRLLATAIEALEEVGIGLPRNHLALLRSWGTLTLLVKPAGFSSEEIRALREFADSRRFDLDYFPGIQPHEANRYNRFPEPIYYQMMTQLLDPAQRKMLYQTYPFEIRPLSDDRPFFTYVLRLDRLGQAYSLVRGKWLFFVEAGLLVPVMLIQAAILAALLILLPTRFKRRTARQEPKWPRRACLPDRRGRVFIYFFCIALGFMGIEMAMIQRLILYLAHPVYAISVVIGSLLLFAGLGSMLTVRWNFHRTSIQARILVILCLLIVAEAFLLPWIVKHTIGMYLWGRFILAFLLMAPLGLFMGMPFPLGMERLKRAEQRDTIAWAWAINGSTSVVAAIFAVVLALQIGFTGVFFMAAISYGAAGWSAVRPWVFTEPGASVPHPP